MTTIEIEYLRRHAERHREPATAHAADYRTAPHEQPEYVAARIAEERAHAATRAVRLLVSGNRGHAHFVMARSFLTQCRLAGIHLRNGDITPRLTVIDPFLGSPMGMDRQLLEDLGHQVHPRYEATGDTGGAA